MWTGLTSKADDEEDTILPLGNANAVLQSGEETWRLRVNTVILIPRDRHRVRLCFGGPQGSVVIERSRTVFWLLTSKFLEESVAADQPNKPLRSRGKRS